MGVPGSGSPGRAAQRYRRSARGPRAGHGRPRFTVHGPARVHSGRACAGCREHRGIRSPGGTASVSESTADSSATGPTRPSRPVRRSAWCVSWWLWLLGLAAAAVLAAEVYLGAPGRPAWLPYADPAAADTPALLGCLSRLRVGRAPTASCGSTTPTCRCGTSPGWPCWTRPPDATRSGRAPTRSRSWSSGRGSRRGPGGARRPGRPDPVLGGQRPAPAELAAALLAARAAARLARRRQ